MDVHEQRRMRPPEMFIVDREISRPVQNQGDPNMITAIVTITNAVSTRYAKVASLRSSSCSPQSKEKNTCGTALDSILHPDARRGRTTCIVAYTGQRDRRIAESESRQERSRDTISARIEAAGPVENLLIASTTRSWRKETIPFDSTHIYCAWR